MPVTTKSYVGSTILCAVAIASVAGCGGGTDREVEKTRTSPSTTTTPKTFTLSGTLTVLNSGTGMSIVDGDPCDPSDTSDLFDLAEGSPIVVKGASGSDLGLGRVPLGEARPNGRISTGVGNDVFNCDLAFTIANIPSGEAVYQLVIGDRDPVRFTEDEAASISLSVDTGMETAAPSN